MTFSMRSCRRITAIAILISTSLLAHSCASPSNVSENTIKHSAPTIEFSEEEIRHILRHSPIPPPEDPTNRYMSSDVAARLGQSLFFDTRLSANREISCASCHDPAKGFADGRPIAEGLRVGRRHAPTLWNAAYNRWFFWDGRADSLWSQALHPIESPLEMGSSRLAVAHLINEDIHLRDQYEKCFGLLPDLTDRSRFPDFAKPATGADPSADESTWNSMRIEDQNLVNRVFVNIGKALAAYEAKMMSRNSPFDRFVIGLANNPPEKNSAISESAQRGLKLFIGRANCRACHMGPNFTDGEFHDTRVPPNHGEPPTDPGRFAGIDEVLRDPFNAAGEYSDRQTGTAVEFLTNNPDNWGRFKTPTLRNVALSAPYMHQGQFATLRDVLHFYSTFDGALPAGHHAETILKPLFLTDTEMNDLIAFLESLTDMSVAPDLLRPR